MDGGEKGSLLQWFMSVDGGDRERLGNTLEPLVVVSGDGGKTKWVRMVGDGGSVWKPFNPREVVVSPGQILDFHRYPVVPMAAKEGPIWIANTDVDDDRAHWTTNVTVNEAGEKEAREITIPVETWIEAFSYRFPGAVSTVSRRSDGKGVYAINLPPIKEGPARTIIFENNSKSEAKAMLNASLKAIAEVVCGKAMMAVPSKERCPKAVQKEVDLVEHLIIIAGYADNPIMTTKQAEDLIEEEKMARASGIMKADESLKPEELVKQSKVMEKQADRLRVLGNNDQTQVEIIRIKILAMAEKYLELVVDHPELKSKWMWPTLEKLDRYLSGSGNGLLGRVAVDELRRIVLSGVDRREEDTLAVVKATSRAVEPVKEEREQRLARVRRRMTGSEKGGWPDRKALLELSDWLEDERTGEARIEMAVFSPETGFRPQRVEIPLKGTVTFGPAGEFRLRYRGDEDGRYQIESQNEDGDCLVNGKRIEKGGMVMVKEGDVLVTGDLSGKRQMEIFRVTMNKALSPRDIVVKRYNGEAHLFYTGDGNPFGVDITRINYIVGGCRLTGFDIMETLKEGEKRLVEWINGVGRRNETDGSYLEQVNAIEVLNGTGNYTIKRKPLDKVMVIGRASVTDEKYGEGKMVVNGATKELSRESVRVEKDSKGDYWMTVTAENADFVHLNGEPVYKKDRLRLLAGDVIGVYNDLFCFSTRTENVEN